MLPKKTTTTLTINPELLALAKSQGINVSEALEEILNVKLNIISNERAELVKKITQKERELKLLNMQLEELKERDREREEQELLERIKKSRGLIP